MTNKRMEIIYKTIPDHLTMNPDFVLVKLFNDAILKSHSCNSLKRAKEIVNRYRVEGEVIEVYGCEWQREEGWCIQLTKKQMWNIEDRMDQGTWHRY